MKDKRFCAVLPLLIFAVDLAPAGQVRHYVVGLEPGRVYEVAVCDSAVWIAEADAAGLMAFSSTCVSPTSIRPAGSSGIEEPEIAPPVPDKPRRRFGCAR